MCSITCTRGNCPSFLGNRLVFDYESDSDLALDETAEVMSQIWMVTLGTPQYPGNELVDMILDGRKVVKYWSDKMVNCADQWICLIELHTSNNKNHRVRCAIQVNVRPVKGEQWRRKEWGWNEDIYQQQLEDTEHMHTTRVYQITDVNAFGKEIFVKQSGQGMAWVLKTGSPHLEDAIAIAQAVHGAHRIPQNVTTKPVVKNILDELSERAKRKQLRVLKREEIKYFVRPKLEESTRKLVPLLRCCEKRCCVLKYKCDRVVYVESPLTSGVNIKDVSTACQERTTEPSLVIA